MVVPFRGFHLSLRFSFRFLIFRVVFLLDEPFHLYALAFGCYRGLNSAR